MSHRLTRFTFVITVIIPLLLLVFGVFTQLVEAAPININTTSTNNATYPGVMNHMVVTSDSTIPTFLQLGTETMTCDGAPTNGLVWVMSTDSGATWDCQGQLSSDTTNLKFASAQKDSSDNIYVVYSGIDNTLSTAYDVLYRKLTKGAGSTWTLEDEQVLLDGTAAESYSYATIAIEGTTRLWVSARIWDGTMYDVLVYYSNGFT